MDIRKKDLPIPRLRGPLPATAAILGCLTTAPFAAGQAYNIINGDFEADAAANVAPPTGWTDNTPTSFWTGVVDTAGNPTSAEAALAPAPGLGGYFLSASREAPGVGSQPAAGQLVQTIDLSSFAAAIDGGGKVVSVEWIWASDDSRDVGSVTATLFSSTDGTGTPVGTASVAMNTGDGFNFVGWFEEYMEIAAPAGTRSVTLTIDTSRPGGGSSTNLWIDNISGEVRDPNSDTDEDGVSNSDETSGAANPYDSLGDFVGAGNGGAPTDPADPDSDDDGITDGEEITAGTDGFLTNPNHEDTDQDFLLDLWEIENGLDPTDDGFTNMVTGDPGDLNNGDFGDPDNDGLDNFGEQDNGTDPQVADTDSDGAEDNDELTGALNTWTAGVNGSAPGDPTNPLVEDSDGDGLLDGAEMTVHGTDPNQIDSDGDTFSDALEIAEGTDPTDGGDSPTGFIAITNSVPGITLPSTASDASGLLFTTASFDMAGGNAVVLLVTSEGFGTVPTATFAGQPMTALHAESTAQKSTVFYLINPATTVGQFSVKVGANDTGNEIAYSQIAFSNVPDVSDTATASSTSTANTTPIDLNYTAPSNDGIVITAAVNNDDNGARSLSVAYGNPDTDLLPHTNVGSSGHFHTFGRTGISGPKTDGYLGQYQRTAIASVVFGATPSFPDEDNDGLDDIAFEDFHFGDNDGTSDETERLLVRGTQAQNPALGAEWDNDSDGASNLQEQNAGTDPTDPDTDGDGLTDGAEINTHGTSPLFADSDGDGLDDLEEVTAGTDGYITNPLNDDTDNDDLLDKWESDNLLDPTSPAGDDGTIGNPDADGLTNEQEQSLGTHPKVADTDTDGVNDGDEVNGTLNVWVAGVASGPPGEPTDPLDADSDNDSLTDGEEINDHGTDPNNVDTDGDDYNDAVELAEGSDPLDGGSVPSAFIQVVSSTTPVTVNNTAATVGPDGVLFTSDSFDMGAGANAVALIVTTEGSGTSSSHGATFAGQAMTEMYTEDNGAGVQTAAVYYIIDPAITTGTFQLILDADFSGTTDYAYTAVSLSNVTSVSATGFARSVSTANTTPLNVSYTTDTNNGYLLSAAVNNDFNSTRVLSVASGNPDIDLLAHTVVDSSGHFHTSGRVGPAGSYTDGYLGQYQRTAISTVVFGGAPVAGGGYGDWAAANAGGQEPDGDFDLDGVDNGIEFFMGETGSTFTATPGVVDGKVTWPKSAEFSGSYLVQTSPDLVTWTDVTGSAVDDGGSVEYTVPTGAGKLFVRLLVTPE